jgi:putative intracellular protease/amidase
MNSAPWVISLAFGLSCTLGPLTTAGQAQTTAGAPGADSAARRMAAQPVIVVVGSNDATELTDFLIPRAILAEAGIGTVFTVAPARAPIRFNRSGLTVDPDLTTAAFDASHPMGADYIVVPNLMPHDDPAVLGWLRRQAALGATIVGVCDGVWTVAEARLLDGRRATGHWASLKSLARTFPRTRWVWDQRYVSDGRIVTTTGVTAAVPVSLMLVARVGGQPAGDTLARRIGVGEWNTTHDSHAFRFTWTMWALLVYDQVAFWRHDEIVVPVANGVDEIALGLSLDAISRRATVLTLFDTGATVIGRQGLRFSADRRRDRGTTFSRTLPLPAAPATPTSALDSTLAQLATWYGQRTADFIAIQMEYTPHQARRRQGARLSSSRMGPGKEQGLDEATRRLSRLDARQKL